MNLNLDETEPLTLRSACSRCHGHKLRCVQVRGAQGCARCTRAGVKCVVRPSKRVRRERERGQTMAMTMTMGQSRRGSRSERGSSSSSRTCLCMEAATPTPTPTPSTTPPETRARTQSVVENLPLTPYTPTNDFDSVDYWGSFELGDAVPSLAASKADDPVAFCMFDPAMQVDGDANGDRALLDPAALVLPTRSPPASTNLSEVQEWNDQPPPGNRPAVGSVGGGQNGEDSPSRREPTPATKDEEHSRASKIDEHGSWIGRLFSLHAELGEHQRALGAFVEGCRAGFPGPETPAMVPGFPSQPESGASSFMETTFRLAIELVVLVGELTPSNSRGGTGTGADPDADQTTQPSLVSSLDDTANILLMLSCSTRLLGIFSSVFTCFHQILITDSAQSELKLNHIHTFLPKVSIGPVPVHGSSSRLTLAMVLDSAQNVVAELTAGMMRAVQVVVDGDEDGLSTTLEETQIPGQEGLRDCALQRGGRQLSGPIGRLGRGRGRTETRVSKSRGNGIPPLSAPSSSSSAERGCGCGCAASSAAEGLFTPPWQPTIRMVSATALEAIRVLKEAIP